MYMDPRSSATATAPEEVVRRLNRTGMTLFGLPEEWDGYRYLGSADWGGQEEGAHEVTLCHTPDRQSASPDAGGPRCCVTVSAGAALNSVPALLRQALDLQPPADSSGDEARRWWFNPLQVVQASAAVRDHVMSVDVAGAPTEFRGFEADEVVVVRAAVDDRRRGTDTITLVARTWNLEGLHLRAVEDADPYVRGWDDLVQWWRTGAAQGRS